MSADFYVAVPSADWPTASAVQQCMAERVYPVEFKRFPAFDSKRVVTEGVLVVLDRDTDAYLEGELFPAALAGDDVKSINDRLATSRASFRVTSGDAVMSIRVRSPAEARAASYVISGLIVCFHGYGFEPQGNGHGRGDFAKSLIDSTVALKGF